MGLKKEQIIAYWIAGVFFVVGVVCYAAFPDQSPEQPVRIMFKSTGGKVLFSHKVHAADEGYGIECMECHHDIEEGETPASCSECHSADGEDSPKRSDVFHAQCIECHDEMGGGPAKCAECHVL